MDQTAITYPHTTVNELTGATIKTILEDVADNLFNPDPYLQQGGDMVRVGGLQYSIDPLAKIGAAHRRFAFGRQAARCRQDLQGRRLGAGGRRRKGRTRLGSSGNVYERSQNVEAATA